MKFSGRDFNCFCKLPLLPIEATFQRIQVLEKGKRGLGGVGKKKENVSCKLQGGEDNPYCSFYPIIMKLFGKYLEVLIEMHGIQDDHFLESFSHCANNDISVLVLPGFANRWAVHTEK